MRGKQQEKELRAMAGTVRFGIIGCGGISKAHLKLQLLKGLQQRAVKDKH